MRLRDIVTASWLAVAGIATAHAYVIDTTPQYIGTVGQFGFNSWQYQYAGQTLGFAEPTAIDGFSFFASSAGGTAVVQGYLATWLGNKPGSILFESSPVDVLLSNPYYQPHTEIGFTFSPIQLDPSAEYIAFLRFRKQSESGWTWPSPVYLDFSGDAIQGNLVLGGVTGYDRNEISLTDVSLGSAGTLDAVMKISLASSIPEPESYALVLLGLGFLGITSRKKAVTV